MFGGKGHVDWRSSVRCSTGACVEVAHDETGFLVRDSKAPDQNLRFTLPAWGAFVAALKAGEFSRSGDLGGGLVEGGE